MNIFDIQNNLQNIIDTIEDNGGEITEELESSLWIEEENLIEKARAYTEVIKKLNADIKVIKEEENRLKVLKKSKENVIKRLTNLLIPAIERFGKNGKTIEWATGKVSIRPSKSIATDDTVLTYISKAINANVKWLEDTNQLDIYDNLSIEDLITTINTLANNESNSDDVIDFNDLSLVNAKIAFNIPISELIKDKYEILKLLAKNVNLLDIESYIDKTKNKETIADNQFKIAYQVINKNLNIK